MLSARLTRHLLASDIFIKISYSNFLCFLYTIKSFFLLLFVSVVIKRLNFFFFAIWFH